jgi:hypothetical protein
MGSGRFAVQSSLADKAHVVARLGNCFHGVDSRDYEGHCCHDADNRDYNKLMIFDVATPVIFA